MTATATDTFYAIRDAYLAQFQITAGYQALFTDITTTTPNPHTRMVLKLVDDVVRADELIADLGTQIINRVERVNVQIGQRHNINSLGELQRLPVEYDMACAARGIAIENLTHAASCYRKAQG
jgi:hypothetical protein